MRIVGSVGIFDDGRTVYIRIICDGNVALLQRMLEDQLALHSTSGRIPPSHNSIACVAISAVLNRFSNCVMIASHHCQLPGAMPRQEFVNAVDWMIGDVS